MGGLKFIVLQIIYLKLSMKHLTLKDRYYIYCRLKQNDSIRSIAKTLNVSHSTISREIKRNSGMKGYRYKQAEYFAIYRAKQKKKYIKLTEEMKEKIKFLLKVNNSPEQISGRWKLLKEEDISHQTIYRYLWKDYQGGGSLIKTLKHKGKPYRKRYGGKDYQGVIPYRVDLEKRPEVVDKKTRIGDWECDLITGSRHKGNILTLVERKSRLLLSCLLRNKTSKEVSSKMISLLEGIKDKVWTITFDNGREFSDHYKVAKIIGCNTYFTKPYSSWQRGLNENTNGLLRRYFPKSMRLDTIKEEVLKKATLEINNRPRKCLGYYTNLEVFTKTYKESINLTSGAFMT